MTSKRSKASKLQHYLITIDLTPRPSHLHAYVMTNDKRYTTTVGEEMIEFAEKTFGRLMLPIILCTLLDTGVDEVRKTLCERSPEVKKALADATDFHRTVWELPTNDPWDARLMDLH